MLHLHWTPEQCFSVSHPIYLIELDFSIDRHKGNVTTYIVHNCCVSIYYNYKKCCLKEIHLLLSVLVLLQRTYPELLQNASLILLPGLNKMG